MEKYWCDQASFQNDSWPNLDISVFACFGQFGTFFIFALNNRQDLNNVVNGISCAACKLLSRITTHCTCCYFGVFQTKPSISPLLRPSSTYRGINIVQSVEVYWVFLFVYQKISSDEITTWLSIHLFLSPCKWFLETKWEEQSSAPNISIKTKIFAREPNSFANHHIADGFRTEVYVIFGPMK